VWRTRTQRSLPDDCRSTTFDSISLKPTLIWFPSVWQCGHSIPPLHLTSATLATPSRHTTLTGISHQSILYTVYRTLYTSLGVPFLCNSQPLFTPAAISTHLPSPSLFQTGQRADADYVSVGSVRVGAACPATKCGSQPSSKRHPLLGKEESPNREMLDCRI
jgi:hypothetical protein